MNTYIKFLVCGVLAMLQACVVQHKPDWVLSKDEVEGMYAIGAKHLEKEAQDPNYLPPGYTKLDRKEVEAVLSGKAFTFVNPISGWQFRAEMTVENKVIVRGTSSKSWSGDAYWAPFSSGAYQNRDKLCLTSAFCFVFSRFDDLQGEDILGARVHRNGKEMLGFNYLYWVFTDITPLPVPVEPVSQ